ncbi:MAG: M13 family metallopeptidase N-terminal domain-containing protein, partial [Lysobacteraceae bacterium]
MKRQIVAAIGFALLTGFASAATPPVSGLKRSDMDTSVRPQDDFYQYVNGHWLATTEIPADMQSYGSGWLVYDKSIENLRSIIEQAQKQPANEGQRKVGDLYASFMDEPKLEALGTGPLKRELARIDAVKDGSDLARLIAHNGIAGVDAPFGLVVHQDNKDSTKYVVDFAQAGLGLPDRDYYLSDDAKFKQFRVDYIAHIERMLLLGGDTAAHDAAAKVMALETELAKIQWTKVENRDPVKAYNKVQVADLGAIAPGFDWNAFLAEARVAGKVSYVIVSQPSYIKAMAGLLKDTPLPVWKTYFRWQLLHASAPYLGKAFVDENFGFFSTILRGVPEQRPRWKRGVAVVENGMGEQLGQVYVTKYFPPTAKARVQELVGNLQEAYKESIGTLTWMTPATKQQALAKLAAFTPKIGYPDTWRDYSALRIERDDLYGNVGRAT